MKFTFQCSLTEVLLEHRTPLWAPCVQWPADKKGSHRLGGAADPDQQDKVQWSGIQGITQVPLPTLYGRPLCLWMDWCGNPGLKGIRLLVSDTQEWGCHTDRQATETSRSGRPAGREGDRGSSALQCIAHSAGCIWLPMKASKGLLFMFLTFLVCWVFYYPILCLNFLEEMLSHQETRPSALVG